MIKCVYIVNNMKIKHIVFDQMYFINMPSGSEYLIGVLSISQCPSWVS